QAPGIRPFNTAQLA
ncbi:hypothetical protein SSYM_0364, partial [Serratia symbiotica str. Tucson]